jgi:tetratricopeptide (TPR) repeat protein
VTAEPAAYVARRRGEALIELRRFDEALAHLARAAGEDPSDRVTQCLIAQAQIGLRRPDDALAAAGRAVALDPEAEWPHRLRAVALAALDRWVQARDAAVRSCALAPELAPPHRVLSQMLQLTGDEAGARRAAERAVELEPESADAHSQLGLILLAQEDRRAAASEFRVALALNPEHDAAHNNLAVAELRGGHRGEAVRGLERAARLDPGSDVVRRNILLFSGRPRIARRFAIAFGLFAVLALVLGAPGAAAIWVAAAAVCELLRALALRRLSPATRRLVLDDAHARRRSPARWDWRWPTRLRPWWWIALAVIPPPVAFLLDLGLVAVLAAERSVVVLAFLITLPMTATRAWRWWRRRHPGQGSWAPSAESPAPSRASSRAP